MSCTAKTWRKKEEIEAFWRRLLSGLLGGTDAPHGPLDCIWQRYISGQWWCTLTHPGLRWCTKPAEDEEPGTLEDDSLISYLGSITGCLCNPGKTFFEASHSDYGLSNLIIVHEYPNFHFPTNHTTEPLIFMKVRFVHLKGTKFYMQNRKRDTDV